MRNRAGAGPIRGSPYFARSSYTLEVAVVREIMG